MFEFYINKQKIDNANDFIAQLNVSSLSQLEKYKLCDYKPSIVVNNSMIFSKICFEDNTMIEQLDENNIYCGKICSDVINYSMINSFGTIIQWNDKQIIVYLVKIGDNNGGHIINKFNCDTNEIDEFTNILRMWKSIHKILVTIDPLT